MLEQQNTMNTQMVDYFNDTFPMASPNGLLST